jgi:very-short-patch-repair endonuclease
MTPAEQRVWVAVRDGRLNGLHIRRQNAPGPYVADFYHAPSRMVLEIDGDVHAEPEQALRDQQREAWLACQGYRVIRFTNEDVFKRLSGVLEAIREARGGAGQPETSEA